MVFLKWNLSHHLPIKFTPLLWGKFSSPKSNNMIVGVLTRTMQYIKLHDFHLKNNTFFAKLFDQCPWAFSTASEPTFPPKYYQVRRIPWYSQAAAPSHKSRARTARAGSSAGPWPPASSHGGLPRTRSRGGVHTHLPGVRGHLTGCSGSSASHP